MDNLVKGSCTILYQLGFNIYGFLGSFRRGLREKRSRLFAPTYEIPDEILKPILRQMVDNWQSIGHPFPWLKKVLQKEIERWWVNKQVKESEKLKSDPIVRVNEILSVGEVLKGMKYGSGIR